MRYSFKYVIIEMEYKDIEYSGGKTKIEICSHAHKTNSYLLSLLIRFCLKIKGIRYDFINNTKKD